jgi:Predicted membrane protein
MPSEETAPPTAPPKSAPSERRIRRSAGISTAFRAIKAQHSSNRSTMEVLADRMIGFASSTPFLVIHAMIFILWIYWNLPFTGLPKFDPYPFGMLTTIVSLEAIFLSIFVLMTQSRESRIGELREELTLQVNLRMEEEITKTLHLVAGLYSRLNLALADDPELRAMLEPLDPKKMETDLTDQINASMPEFKLRKRKEPAKP